MLNTIEGATKKQMKGVKLFAEKLNIMVAGALAINGGHWNSPSNEAFNLMYGIVHREIPEGFLAEDVRELIKIRKDYDLEDHVSFNHLAEVFHWEAMAQQ